MSMNWDAARTEESWRGRCGSRWRAFEIVAMVIGFVVFWPIGLAIIAFKIWQRKTGYPGDLFAFCRETVGAMTSGGFAASPLGQAKRRTYSRWSCGGPSSRRATPKSGNSAFDEWRNGELDRLEEERKKLETAEREFAEYLDTLRRARDREEFERFMREKRPSST